MTVRVEPLPEVRPVNRQEAPPAPSDTGTTGVAVALALAVAAMPLLTPAGPGNTGPADLFLCVALVVTGLWLHRSRATVSVPYSLGVGLLMLGGALSAWYVTSVTSGLTVVQDAFCLLWGSAVANAVRKDVRLLGVVVGTWCWTGLGWAAVLVTGKLLGLDALAGITAKDGGRASLTFDDPNLCGNYFLCVFFVLLASRVGRYRVVRALGVLLLLTAILFTGSNGAVLGVVLGSAVALVVRVRRNRGPIAAAALVCAVLVVGGVAEPYVHLSTLREKASDSVQLLRDSFGRSDESSSEREILFTEGMDLYGHGNLIGVAPGRTKATLADTSAPYVKEAHNDYVATLVERGVVGGLGLAVLIATIGLRLGRLSFGPQPTRAGALVPRPEMLLGLGCAFLFAASFYEVLHFRHLWAFLGLVAGLDPGVRRAWRR